MLVLMLSKVDPGNLSFIDDHCVSMMAFIVVARKGKTKRQKRKTQQQKQKTK